MSKRIPREDLNTAEYEGGHLLIREIEHSLKYVRVNSSSPLARRFQQYEIIVMILSTLKLLLIAQLEKIGSVGKPNEPEIRKLRVLFRESEDMIYDPDIIINYANKKEVKKNTEAFEQMREELHTLSGNEVVQIQEYVHTAKQNFEQRMNIDRK